MTQSISTVISHMDLLLRNTLSENGQKKLWENTDRTDFEKYQRISADRGSLIFFCWEI